MDTRRGSVEFLVGLVVGAAVLAWLAVPAFPATTLSSVEIPVTVPVPDAFPQWLALGGLLLGAVAAWLVAMWLGVELVGVGLRLASPVVRLVRAALPESQVWRFVTLSFVFVVVVMVFIGVLPTVLNQLTVNPVASADFTQNLQNRGLNDEWEEIVADDTVAGAGDCEDARVDSADTDGDGIPDAWESAGTTPDGADLPDADPGRKDLYVQLNYGADVTSLTDAEREQLRAAFARMPVENPDGSTGIRLHLRESGPMDPTVDEEVVVEDRADHDRYYTREFLDVRDCVSRQVTYGQVELSTASVVVSTPGYPAVVEGRRVAAYDGDVSFRVALTVHALLHAVAGPVDGQPHTAEGWLAGGPGNEFLSEPTATRLNRSGMYGPAR
jgi:hypothetical protein